VALVLHLFELDLLLLLFEEQVEFVASLQQVLELEACCFWPDLPAAGLVLLDLPGHFLFAGSLESTVLPAQAELAELVISPGLPVLVFVEAGFLVALEPGCSWLGLQFDYLQQKFWQDS
jgi:hypothetical protein